MQTVQNHAKQARKLGRCVSYLRKLKKLPTDPLTELLTDCPKFQIQCFHNGRQELFAKNTEKLGKPKTPVSQFLHIHMY